MSLTERQLKKKNLLGHIIAEQEVAIADEIIKLEDKVDSNYQEMAEGVSTALEIALETQKMAGEPGYTPQKGIDYEDGKDYVLTEEDKTEIASKITPTVVEKVVVEKVIEKTEVVHEQPIVTEVTKTIENEVTAPEIVTKLESLKDDDRLDVSAIKGLGKRFKKLTEDILNRAIGILDQRTSFLINKVSNLQTQVNNLPSGGGSTGFSNFTITRSGDYISSVLVGSTTYTISRSGTYISSITDGSQTVTFTRNGSNQITDGVVS